MGPAPKFDLDAGNWMVISRLLDTALELSPGEREQWLANLGPEYDAVRDRLRDLLSRANRPEALIQTLEGLPFAEPAESSGDTFGPYRLLHQLGRGGMGTVWLAERTDGMVNRPVALKLPRGNWNAALLQRMARERSILAGLNHPNIARLYDAGITEAGNPWLALEYIEGRSIDEYCRSKELGVADRLHLFLDVAGAVAHAHGRLVVHRDLKPANVLVTDDGEVRLLDFGIAALLEQDAESAESGLTKIAGCALTPEYASPEQIRGEPIGVASDIYSLGVMLYELLTGARPYNLKRDSRAALENAILEGDPASPSSVASSVALRRALRGDLDTIIFKALAKKPENRYATVDAFADDIRNHLSGRPVLARPASPFYRLSRLVARNRIAFAAGALVLIAIVAGAGAATWQARKAIDEKRRAEEVKAFIAGIFQDANLDRNEGRSMTALEVLKRASGRIDRSLGAGPPIRLELMTIVGSSLMSLGDSAAAEAIADKAVAEARRHFPPQDPLALRAHLLRAWTLMYRGKTKEMRAELDGVFPLLRQNTSQDPADLVFAWRLRCGLSVDEGKPEEAQAHGREAVRLADATLSEHHREKLLALLELAYAYGQSRGTTAQQRETSLRAYRLAGKAHQNNPLHPMLMKARAAHGNALASSGSLEEGIGLLEQSRSDAATLFGPSSMTVAVYSQNLIDFQLRAGLVANALASSNQAFQIYEQSADRESYTYMSVQRMHGLALSAARRMNEAVPVLTRAVQASLRVLGPSNRLTLENRALRARALGFTGAFEEAGRELEDVHEALHAGSHPTIYIPLRFQAVLAQLRGDYRAALALSQAALQRMSAGAASPAWRGRTLAEAASSQLELNAVEEAHRSLEEAQALLSHPDGRMHPDLADVLVGLGRVKMRRARFAEALPLLQKADAFWREFDPDNRWAGEAALWLAICHRSLGQAGDARRVSLRADRILSASPLPVDRRMRASLASK